jgi:Reverse transcriptase (RNA-dependent DNA polymerase)
MDEEIRAIERNKTWELVELPEGYRPIGVKWVYKKKMNAQGKIERYKARLVAKGYR